MSLGPDEGEAWNPAAPSESTTDFDGLFSWAGESHPFAIGVAVGLTAEPGLLTAFTGFALAGAKAQYNFSDDPHVRQVVEEPAYALGGMVLGYLLNTMTVASTASGLVMGL